MKAIGPNFYNELCKAGLNGLPFGWRADGTIMFDAAMTAAQITAVQNVYAAHDPTKPDLRAAARAELLVNDMVAWRCFKAGVALPAAWQTHAQANRAIANGTDTTSTTLPTRPAFPGGT